MLLRFLFGDDIFISYSRKDGANYAAALANELSKPGRDFSCFLDQWGASAANELSKPVMRALRRSSVLVLVGTQGAINSQFVRQEVENFSQQSWPREHRPILPVNINGALDRVDWEKLTGLHRTPETEEARAEGLPSESVIRLVANSYSFTKRNQRVRWLSLSALILLLASITASVLAWQQSRRANEEAQNAIAQGKLAEENRVRAEKAAKEAIDNAQKAQENAKEAENQAALARENEKKAQEKTAESRKNAEAAERQQKIAESNARTAQSQELASYSAALRQIDPDLSLSLINEATRRARTSHAEDAFRQFMLETPMRAILRGDSASVLSAAYSPDGKFIVTASADRTARVWNASTAVMVAELKGHPAYVLNAAYSPDGKFIITASADRSARIYPQVMFMPFDELMELARKLSPRELTPEERERYLHEPQSKQEIRNDSPKPKKNPK